MGALHIRCSQPLLRRLTIPYQPEPAESAAAWASVHE
jgi:hypothetical protein